MKKENGMKRKIIISGCVLSALGFGSYICYLFLAPQAPEPVPAPQAPTEAPEAPPVTNKPPEVPTVPQAPKKINLQDLRMDELKNTYGFANAFIPSAGNFRDQAVKLFKESLMFSINKYENKGNWEPRPKWSDLTLDDVDIVLPNGGIITSDMFKYVTQSSHHYPTYNFNIKIIAKKTSKNFYGDTILQIPYSPYM